MSNIPYPGLRPFERDESDIFFGREEHTDQLLEKLSQTRFISVVGLSGCGKSSLVRAGMLAALETGYLSKAGPRWQVAAMRPGNQPVYNLANALLEKAVVPRDTPDAEYLTYRMASYGPLGLVEVLRETPLPRRTNLLLLIDQFEEIFRYYREENLDEAEAFVDLLLTSAEQREVPIYVVITMRSDFIGNCALFRDLPEMINKGQFLVPRLTRDQQRMAIVGPAKVFGGDIEPRLINRLLNEMGYDPDQLPLLQHCLMRMWYRAGTRAEAQNEDVHNGVMMTLDDYEAAGGLKDALSNHAEEAFAELDEKGQQIAETMFRCLSERGADQRDIRRPAQVHEIAAVADVSASEVMEVVEVFRHPERCFLTPAAGVPLEPDSVLDIGHESLIRQWQRMSGWVEQEADSAETYRHLERTAMLWRQGQAALWRSPDLDIALKWKEEQNPTQEWAGRYGSHFDLATEFLEASAQAQEEQRRQEKQAQEEKHRRELKLKYARRQLAVVIVGLVIAIIFAGLAFIQRQEALKAQKQERLQSSRFQEMVIATFGFLSDSEQNKKFLEWIEKTVTIERFIPALGVMIDSSEKLNEQSKKEWKNNLPAMTEKQQLSLFNTLGTEAAEKAGSNVHIQQVEIRDEDDNPMSLVGGICFLQHGEQVTVNVDVNNPFAWELEIQYAAEQGIISSEDATYIAPNTPGSIDFVTVTVLDKNLNKTIAYDSIAIQIIE